MGKVVDNDFRGFDFASWCVIECHILDLQELNCLLNYVALNILLKQVLSVKETIGIDWDFSMVVWLESTVGLVNYKNLKYFREYPDHTGLVLHIKIWKVEQKF